MTDDQVDWGVPDWRDAKAYPGWDEIGILGWRWEFLRRNPEYRRDWSRPESTFVNPDWTENDPEGWYLESKERYFEREYHLARIIHDAA